MATSTRSKKSGAECYWCNDKGKCFNCQCSKHGLACSNCFPLKRGHCFNRFNGPSPLDPLSVCPSPAVLSSNSQPSSPPSTVDHPQPSHCGRSQSPFSPCDTLPPIPSLLPIPDLPPFTHLPSNPVFSWGSAEETSVIPLLDKIYKEVVCWKRNLFRVPFGSAGKRFVSEMARLFFDYANCSSTV